MDQNPIISTIHSEDKSSSFFVKKGITDGQISQLIQYALEDPDLAKFTSDPKRFKDRASFDEFSTHIMTYYVLVDETDHLLGIIWFDDSALPVIPAEAGIHLLQSEKASSVYKNEELNGSLVKPVMTYEAYGISYAIRVYNGARGKGVALPFSQAAFEDFYKSPEYLGHLNRKIWLAVSPDNIPAKKVYEKLGFKDLKMNKEENKLLMILN